MHWRSLLVALLMMSVLLVSMPNARAGDVDADGPYVGEVGKPITFNVASHAPETTHFRWDVDNDTVFDLPDQSGCGPMGCWTTNESVTHTYSEEYIGDAVVEGWDANATHLVNMTGTVLRGEDRVNWIFSFPVVGWKFSPERNLKLLALGYYNGGNPSQTHMPFLWDADSQTALRSCRPDDVPLSWNWCSISPITLTWGSRYVISIYSASYTNVGTSWSNIEPQPEVLTVGGFVYGAGGYPWQTGPSPAMPMVDILWSYPETVPKTVNDSALVIVRQPRMFDYPGCRATVVFRSATVNADNEPGDDEWMFRLRTEMGMWRTYPPTGHYTLRPEYPLPFMIPINRIDSSVFKGGKGEVVQVRVTAMAIEDDPRFDDFALGSARVEGLCDGSIVHSTISLKGLWLFSRGPVDVDLRLAVLFEP